nr:DUF2267 domain-containing protein [Streptomyces sp. SID14446]
MGELRPAASPRPARGPVTCAADGARARVRRRGHRRGVRRPRPARAGPAVACQGGSRAVGPRDRQGSGTPPRQTAEPPDHRRGRRRQRVEEREFVQAVSERTGLSRQESADLTRATLETLAHRLSGGEDRALERELPEGLAESVRRGATSAIEAFSYAETVRRVAERNMLKKSEADSGVRAVLVTLRDAISEKEFGNLMSQLGSDFSQPVEDFAG